MQPGPTRIGREGGLVQLLLHSEPFPGFQKRLYEETGSTMYNQGVSNTRVTTCADGSPASRWLPPERTFVAIWAQNYKLNVFIASQYKMDDDVVMETDLPYTGPYALASLTSGTGESSRRQGGSLGGKLHPCSFTF